MTVVSMSSEDGTCPVCGKDLLREVPGRTSIRCAGCGRQLDVDARVYLSVRIERNELIAFLAGGGQPPQGASAR